MQDWLNKLLSYPILIHKSCDHKLLTILMFSQNSETKTLCFHQLLITNR